MLKWMKEELSIRSLDRDYKKTRRQFAKELKEAKDAGADQYQLGHINHGEYFELSTIEDQVDWIKTGQAIRRADRYSVPLPERVEGDDWRMSDRLGQLVLTTAGAMKIRREIAVEIEIRHKPWLNWLAVGISVASLSVALLALQQGNRPQEQERPAEASPINAPQSDIAP